MGFFTNFFKKAGKYKNPEDKFISIITDDYIRIEHPERQVEEIAWKDINEIKLINTDQGPWFPDVWLAMLGENSGCLIPQGSEGFDIVYNIVSKYNDFNFENVSESMKCTINAEFELWKKSL